MTPLQGMGGLCTLGYSAKLANPGAASVRVPGKRNASNHNYTDMCEQSFSAGWFICLCVYYTGLNCNNSSRVEKVLWF